MLLKMIVKGRYADTVRNIVTVENPGQIVEFIDATAKKIIAAGKGVMYKGNREPGSVESLTKDEKALADAFALEKEVATNEET